MTQRFVSFIDWPMKKGILKWEGNLKRGKNSSRSERYQWLAGRGCARIRRRTARESPEGRSTRGTGEPDESSARRTAKCGLCKRCKTGQITTHYSRIQGRVLPAKTKSPYVTFSHGFNALSIAWQRVSSAKVTQLRNRYALRKLPTHRKLLITSPVGANIT